MRSASSGTSRWSMRCTVSNASSGWRTGSCSACVSLSACARAISVFSRTRKPQAKSDPCRSPPNWMGAATISKPMWHGPSSRAPCSTAATAFSLLWLQRRRPSLSPRQLVQIWFCGGMMMPLPWSSTSPLASVKESSIPHQRRTVSRNLRTMCSSSSRPVSMATSLPQLLLQRCKAQIRHLGHGPGAVDRNHAGQRADQPRILALDGLQLRRRLVALELGAAGAHALQRHAGRDIEEERQVGLARVAVGGLDELVRDAGALVRQRAPGVAIEDAVSAAREARLDLRAEVVEPVGGEEQRHDALVDTAPLPVGLGGGA